MRGDILLTRLPSLNADGEMALSSPPTNFSVNCSSAISLSLSRFTLTPVSRIPSNSRYTLTPDTAHSFPRVSPVIRKKGRERVINVRTLLLAIESKYKQNTRMLNAKFDYF